MAIRERLKHLLRVHPSPAPRPPIRAAAPAPAPVVADGPELRLDLDAVGWSGVAGFHGARVVVTAAESWQAAAAAELLGARGVHARWEDRA